MRFMKDVWSKNDKYFQHEFGCGVRVRFEKVEFSDGLKIWIPREADNSIHDCPNLPNNDEDDEIAEVYTPEDPDIFDEWMADEWAPWDKDEVVKHFSDLVNNFGYCPNLEFKNTRQCEKEFLVENLEASSQFYFHLTLQPVEVDMETPIPLPPCLDLSEPDGVGTFSPLELLGLFYEMDGALLDARKCFEINKEMGWDAKWCQSKIDQINKNIADIEEEKLRQKSAAEAIKNVITPTEKVKPDVEMEDESIIWKEIKTFENKDLKKYAFAKISKDKLNNHLKTTVVGNRTEYVKGKKEYIEITLFDQIKKYHRNDEKRMQTRKNPIDWDYLSLGQKITILTSFIKNDKEHDRSSQFYQQHHLDVENCKCAKCEISDCLWRINDHRNFLNHSGEYYPGEIKQVNQEIRICIKKCKDYFEIS